MANSDKNLVITPNVGSSSDDPKIVFSGASSSAGANNVTMKVYPVNNGTLSFEGSAGQLMSVVNTMTGSIYSINDASGIPNVEVKDSGEMFLQKNNAGITVGNASYDSTYKFRVATGNSKFDNNLTVGQYLYCGGLYTVGGSPIIDSSGNWAGAPFSPANGGSTNASNVIDFLYNENSTPVGIGPVCSWAGQGQTKYVRLGKVYQALQSFANSTGNRAGITLLMLQSASPNDTLDFSNTSLDRNGNGGYPGASVYYSGGGQSAPTLSGRQMIVLTAFYNGSSIELYVRSAGTF